jgi:hypothetical protein
MERGFIKLFRSIQDGKHWQEKPFSKAMAWIDLLLLANHKDGVKYVRGIQVTIKRGQVGWGERALADRWGWSRGKVRRFLTELKNDNQIVPQTDNNILGLITITNYHLYQANSTTDDTTNSTTDSTKNNELKNGKNNTDTPSTPPRGKKKKTGFKSWTAEDFKKDIWKYRNEYTIEEMKNFYEYWTEKSASGLFKFAMQKTWDTNLRLKNARRMNVLGGQRQPTEDLSDLNNKLNKLRSSNGTESQATGM